MKIGFIGVGNIEAAHVLEEHGFRSALIEAIIACDAKAKEPSK
jgi:pyrroline-5-carboxylate reductase